MILGAFVRCYVFPSTSHSDPSATQNDKECYIHLRRKFLQEMEKKQQTIEILRVWRFFSLLHRLMNTINVIVILIT